MTKLNAMISHFMALNVTKGCLQKKKVYFGTLAQKGGGGQSKIPNVDQY